MDIRKQERIVQETKSQCSRKKLKNTCVHCYLAWVLTSVFSDKLIQLLPTLTFYWNNWHRNVFSSWKGGLELPTKCILNVVFSLWAGKEGPFRHHHTNANNFSSSCSPSSQQKAARARVQLAKEKRSPRYALKISPSTALWLMVTHSWVEINVLKISLLRKRGSFYLGIQGWIDLPVSFSGWAVSEHVLI